MKSFDYWMLGTIDDSIRLAQVEFFKHKKLLGDKFVEHVGCNPDCANKWCELGKLNLIRARVNEIREDVSDSFKKEEVTKKMKNVCIIEGGLLFELSAEFKKLIKLLDKESQFRQSEKMIAVFKKMSEDAIFESRG